jgi:AcrR family transcriptional regulator
MSQRSSESAERLSSANAIPEQRILDAAYELMLAVGMRRMTMADIARHAEVSRATLYRRWPNVQSVVAALMTREWAIAGAAAFVPGADTRSWLVEGVVEVVNLTRTHPLMRKIIELDPEFLTPYLFERRGSSTNEHLELVEQALQKGYEDGSIRLGDPEWQARTIVLAAFSSAVSGPIMAEPDEYDRLDEELRQMLDRYLAP